MSQADDLVVSEVFGRLDLGAALPGMRELFERWRPHVVLREPAELASYVATVLADATFADHARMVVEELAGLPTISEVVESLSTLV